MIIENFHYLIQLYTVTGASQRTVQKLIPWMNDWIKESMKELISAFATPTGACKNGHTLQQ